MNSLMLSCAEMFSGGVLPVSFDCDREEDTSLVLISEDFDAEKHFEEIRENDRCGREPELRSSSFERLHSSLSVLCVISAIFLVVIPL